MIEILSDPMYAENQSSAMELVNKIVNLTSSAAQRADEISALRQKMDVLKAQIENFHTTSRSEAYHCHSPVSSSTSSSTGSVTVVVETLVPLCRCGKASIADAVWVPTETHPRCFHCLNKINICGLPKDARLP